MTNPWEKIFEGEYETAYQWAEKNYALTAQNFDLRAKAICSVLMENYDQALTDLLQLLSVEEQTNMVSDGTYMEIGLCYYALGDYEKAAVYFSFPVINRKAIKFYSSDISSSPAVLLFLGTKLGQKTLIKSALKELKRLSKFNTPASMYLLGIIDDATLNMASEQENNVTLRNRKQCKAAFYKATAALMSGNDELYKAQIKECVDLKGQRLEFEYFMASVELVKINNL